MNNPTARPTTEDQQYNELKSSVDSANDSLKEKVDAYNKAKDDLEKFKDGKLITTSQFMDHGRKVVDPVFEDYHRLFLSPSGDYFQISLSYHAARVLNPLAVMNMTQPQVEQAVRELKAFEFDEFREGGGIIERMIEQVPEFIALVNATKEDFWNSVEDASDYDMDLTKKAINNNEPVTRTWKDDPIEKARRIWEWWRANHSNPKIHYFAVAARLVALVQVSSAQVERIFSQVKLICETTGVNPLEETVEVRLYERCNNYSITK
jgi:hypothetical protein